MYLQFNVAVYVLFVEIGMMEGICLKLSIKH
jgi:hypothetical protein